MKARTPDPWPEIVARWKKGRIPWNRKVKYPVFFRDLALEKVRGIFVRAAQLTDADVEFVLQLKNARYVSLECDKVSDGQQLERYKDLLKSGLSNLDQIYINDSCEQIER